MRLDLVVATYRRPVLLEETLQSIFDAERPVALRLRVIVVNNDPGTDLTALAHRLRTAPVPVLIREQPLPGKSRALNAGIAGSDADYIGFIDDDERLAPEWLRVAFDALRDGALDFIGGPMRPIWPSAPPAWMPEGFRAVLGIVESSPVRMPYSHGFPGILVGGNAVIRRSLFDRTGLYATDLGPQAPYRLMSCEDEDMYARLLEQGARGEYLPDLVVFHHVHPERIRPSYYRSWCFWNAASKAVMIRHRTSVVPRIGGVPRYMYGRALRGGASWLYALLTGRGAASLLEAELPAWQLAGYVYGRFRLRRLLPASSERPGGRAAPGDARADSRRGSVAGS